MLAGNSEPADMAAGRHLDWELVWGRMADRDRRVLRETAEGYGTGEIAQHCGVSAPRICQVKEQIAGTIRQAWSGTPLADLDRTPRWKHWGRPR